MDIDTLTSSSSDQYDDTESNSCSEEDDCSESKVVKDEFSFRKKKMEYTILKDKKTGLQFGRCYMKKIIVPYDMVPCSNVEGVLPVYTKEECKVKKFKFVKNIYSSNYTFTEMYGKMQVRPPPIGWSKSPDFVKERVSAYAAWIVYNSKNPHTDADLKIAAANLDQYVDKYFKPALIEAHVDIIGKRGVVQESDKKYRLPDNVKIGKESSYNSIPKGDLVIGYYDIPIYYVTKKSRKIIAFKNPLPGIFLGFLEKYRLTDLDKDQQYQKFGTAYYPCIHDGCKVRIVDRKTMNMFEEEFPQIKQSLLNLDIRLYFTFSCIQGLGSKYNQPLYSIDDVDIERTLLMLNRKMEDKVYNCYNGSPRCITTVEVRKIYFKFCKEYVEPKIVQEGHRMDYDEGKYIRKQLKILEQVTDKYESNLSSLKSENASSVQQNKMKRYAVAVANSEQEKKSIKDVIDEMETVVQEPTILEIGGKMCIIGEDKEQAEKKIAAVKKKLSDRTRKKKSSAYLPNDITVSNGEFVCYKQFTVVSPVESLKRGHRSYHTKSLYRDVCRALIEDGWIHPLDRVLKRDDGVIFTDEYDIYIAFHGDYDLTPPPLHLLSVYGLIPDVDSYYCPNFDVDIYRPKTDKVSELNEWKKPSESISEQRQNILKRYAINCFFHKLRYICEVSKLIESDIFRMERMGLDYITLSKISITNGIPPFIPCELDQLAYCYPYTVYVATDQDLLDGKSSVDLRTVMEDPIDSLVEEGYVPSRMRERDGKRVYSSIGEAVVEFYGSYKNRAQNFFDPEDFDLDHTMANESFNIGRNMVLCATPRRRRLYYKEYYSKLVSPQTFISSVVNINEDQKKILSTAVGALSTLREIFDLELDNMRRIDDLRIRYLKDGRSIVEERNYHACRVLASMKEKKHFSPFERLRCFINRRSEMMCKMGISDKTSFNGYLPEKIAKRNVKLVNPEYRHRYLLPEHVEREALNRIYSFQVSAHLMRLRGGEDCEKYKNEISTHLSDWDTIMEETGLTKQSVDLMYKKYTTFVDSLPADKVVRVAVILCDPLIRCLLEVYSNSIAYEIFRLWRDERISNYEKGLDYEFPTLSYRPLILTKGTLLPKSGIRELYNADYQFPHNSEPLSADVSLWYTRWLQKIVKELRFKYVVTGDRDLAYANAIIADDKYFFDDKCVKSLWKWYMCTKKGRKRAICVRVILDEKSRCMVYLSKDSTDKDEMPNFVLPREAANYLSSANLEPPKPYEINTRYGKFSSDNPKSQPLTLLNRDGHWILCPRKMSGSSMVFDKKKGREVKIRKCFYFNSSNQRVYVPDPRFAKDEDESMVDDSENDSLMKSSGLDFSSIPLVKEDDIDDSSFEVEDINLEYTIQSTYRTLTDEKRIERSNNLGIKLLYDECKIDIGNGEFGVCPPLFAEDDDGNMVEYKSGEDEVINWDGSCLGSFSKKEMKIEKVTAQPLDIANLILQIAKFGKKRNYHIRCMVDNADFPHACVVDSLSAYFGIQKVGTHYIKIGKRCLILYRMMNNIPVTLGNVTNEIIERLPDDLYGEIREAIAFKAAMGCGDMRQISFIMCNGRPTFVSSNYRGWDSGKTDMTSVARQRWFSDMETYTPIYRKFFQRIGSKIRIQSIIKSCIKRIDDEYPLHHGILANDILKSLESVRYDIPGISTDTGKNILSTIINRKVNGKWKDLLTFDQPVRQTHQRNIVEISPHVPRQPLVRSISVMDVKKSTSSPIQNTISRRSNPKRMSGIYGAMNSIPSQLSQKKPKRASRKMAMKRSSMMGTIDISSRTNSRSRAQSTTRRNTSVGSRRSSLVKSSDRKSSFRMKSSRGRPSKDELGKSSIVEMSKKYGTSILMSLDMIETDDIEEEKILKEGTRKRPKPRGEGGYSSDSRSSTSRTIEKFRNDMREEAKKRKELSKLEITECLDDDRQIKKITKKLNMQIRVLDQKYRKIASLIVNTIMGIRPLEEHMSEAVDSISPIGEREIPNPNSIPVLSSEEYEKYSESRDMVEDMYSYFHINEYSDFYNFLPEFDEIPKATDEISLFNGVFQFFRHLVSFCPSAKILLHMDTEYIMSILEEKEVTAYYGNFSSGKYDYEEVEKSINLIDGCMIDPVTRDEIDYLYDFENILYHEILMCMFELDSVLENFLKSSIKPEKIKRRGKYPKFERMSFEDCTVKSYKMRYLPFWMISIYMLLLTERMEEDFRDDDDEDIYRKFRLSDATIDEYTTQRETFYEKMEKVCGAKWQKVKKYDINGNQEKLEENGDKRLIDDLDVKMQLCEDIIFNYPKMNVEELDIEKILGYDYHSISEEDKQKYPLIDQLRKAKRDMELRSFYTNRHPEFTVLDSSRQPVTTPEMRKQIMREREDKYFSEDSRTPYKTCELIRNTIGYNPGDSSYSLGKVKEENAKCISWQEIERSKVSEPERELERERFIHDLRSSDVLDEESKRKYDILHTYKESEEWYLEMERVSRENRESERELARMDKKTWGKFCEQEKESQDFIDTITKILEGDNSRLERLGEYEWSTLDFQELSY